MTCVAFILGGTALILQYRVTTIARVYVVRCLTAAVGAIGVLSIAGQILGLPQMFNTYLFSQMTPATAAGLVALSVGLWATWRSEAWNQPHLLKSEVSRIMFASGVIMITIAAVCGLAGFIVMQRSAEKSLGEELTRILNTRVAALMQIIDRRMDGVDRLATQPAVIDYLVALTATPRDARSRRLLRGLADEALTFGLSAATITDARGELIVRSARLVTLPELRLPLRSLGPAALLWHDQFLLHTETVIAGHGRVLGTLIAQQPLPELQKLLNDIGATGATSDLLICAPGNRDIACAPTRLRPQPFYLPRIRNNNPTPIALALEGTSGVLKFKDSRGVEAIIAYAPVGNLGLGMTLRVNTATLYAPIREQLTQLLPVVAILLAAGIALLRARIVPLARKLATSEQRLQLALDGSHLALWDWDVPRNRIYLDEQWQQILGGAAQSTATTVDELRSVVHPDDRRATTTSLIEALKGVRDRYDVEYRVRTRSGEWKWIHSLGKVVEHAADGHALRMTGTNADIDQRKQAELLVEHQAKHDLLTGLPNRVLCYDHLRRAMARSKRYHRLMAVLYLDIDKFKGVNDTLGHTMGDALLKGFARRLADCVRQTDTMARLGGDEFIVILEELHNRDEGRAVAQKIVEAMRPEFVLDYRDTKITTSVGMAFFDGGENVSGDALIKKADQALYDAKSGGRDNYREAA